MRQSRDPQPLREEFPTLVTRALAGEQDGYTALYEATAQELYRCIHAMVRDEELTLDIQQEVYAQAFAHLDQLEDPEKLIPWLRAIAVNCVRYALRRQSPVLFSELEDGEGPPLPELADPDPAHSPELHLERRENARLIREILDGLTEGQRMLVGMYYYEQMPVGQIARDLGVNPGTVKTQLFRSRKKIEAAVKRLEARGVKLYGLSPLPFLLALLKKAEPAAEAEQALRAGSLAGTSPAAESAAVHVGRRFFETLGGRLILGLLAAAVIGGGVLGFGWARDRLRIGDVRPTEPIRIRRSTEPSANSDENLIDVSTGDPEAETEPAPEADSEEELTEPNPEPSDPTESAPEPTEPAPEPTEPAPGPEPGVPPPEPAEPGNPSPPPVVTDAPEPAPTQPAASEPPEPAPETLSLFWHWRSGGEIDWNMDWNAGAGEDGYESRTLTLTMSGYGRPELETDDPGLLRILADSANSSTNTQINESMGWSRDYSWSVTPLADGTTTIRCVVNGRTEKSLRVTVQTPARLWKVFLYTDAPSVGDPEEALADCSVGALFRAGARVSGAQAPTFSTDNPAVVQISSPLAEPDTAPFTRYTAALSIVGVGDARVLLSYDGQIARSWNVHASEPTPPPADSREDLSP